MKKSEILERLSKTPYKLIVEGGPGSGKHHNKPGRRGRRGIAPVQPQGQRQPTTAVSQEVGKTKRKKIENYSFIDNCRNWVRKKFPHFPKVLDFEGAEFLESTEWGPQIKGPDEHVDELPINENHLAELAQKAGVTLQPPPSEQTKKEWKLYTYPNGVTAEINPWGHITSYITHKDGTWEAKEGEPSNHWPTMNDYSFGTAPMDKPSMDFLKEFSEKFVLGDADSKKAFTRRYVPLYKEKIRRGYRTLWADKQTGALYSVVPWWDSDYDNVKIQGARIR